MRSRIVALLSALLLVGAAAALWAQAATPPAASQQTPGMADHTMGGSMMGGEARAGAMMDECKAMMAEHQSMMNKMKATDAQLDSLVKAMNDARGSKKMDATAAVVTELVAQRKAMREAMEAMQTKMMQHMMKHLQNGAAKGMAESMSGCPMMQGAKPEERGHEMHH